MPGRPRKPNAEELAEKYDPKEAGSHRASTMGVDRALANRIREIARAQNVSALDLTNQLIEYGLQHGTFEVEVRKVTFKPKDVKRRGG